MENQSLLMNPFSGFRISNVQKEIPLYEQKESNFIGFDSSEIFSTGKNDFSFITGVNVPSITVFLPDNKKATGIGVIICPGGAYWGLAIKHEGYDIAKKLNEKGIAAFVLKYRLPVDYLINKHLIPLQDAQLAIQIVRKNAELFNINPNKIGIAGSSAGGHLASTAGTNFNKEHIENSSKISLRPDFMILNYPVISMEDGLTDVLTRYNLIGEGLSKKELNLILMDKSTSREKLANVPIDSDMIKVFSNDLQVTLETPPTFISHSVDDNTAKIHNSILFIAALQKNRVPVEHFFYAKGGHGYGIFNPTADDLWIDSCVTWILKIFK
ncbi:alpha/beta hydrolase [Flavobacterium sp. MAHUQ-51]|uniref:alpha/beta hydrolase n=1 Tax=Flavobacterium sp. GCM10022190 TaxID=3252639 RepID=UPI00361F203A